MSTIKNRVILVGNIGNTPELKSFDGGKQLLKISIATNESYKDAKGNWQKETSWHNITVWGNQAETLASTLKKGMEVLIEGKLANNSYSDKQGVKHYTTSVVANDIIPFASKENKQAA